MTLMWTLLKSAELYNPKTPKRTTMSSTTEKAQNGMGDGVVGTNTGNVNVAAVVEQVAVLSLGSGGSANGRGSVVECAGAISVVGATGASSSSGPLQ